MKKVTKKIAKKSGKKVVAVSGGFDPVHVGHVRMFAEARALGDELVVILNNDNWLRDKKGFVFMPQDERAELISHFSSVGKVVHSRHAPGEYFKDKSIVRELEALRPHIFANGGDRKPSGDPIPEVELCKRLGIKVVYNVGHGGKVQSSSELVKRVAKKRR